MPTQFYNSFMNAKVGDFGKWAGESLNTKVGKRVLDGFTKTYSVSCLHLHLMLMLQSSQSPSLSSTLSVVSSESASRHDRCALWFLNPALAAQCVALMRKNPTIATASDATPQQRHRKNVL